MLNNAAVIGSADWWLLRLGQGLSNGYVDLQSTQAYASGQHPLPIGNENMRQTYHKYQKMSRSNYCGLIVSAVCERLAVQGFYSGGLNPVTDSGAWQIWQGNSLDAESDTVHNTAVALGRSYVIVGPPDPTDPETPTIPVITVESPFQVFHEADPCRPRRVMAAIKTYFDSIRNLQVAIVYMPGGIYYYQAAKTGQMTAAWQANAWSIDDSEFPDGVAPNPLGVVPVVPFINRQQLNPMGVSEFGDVTDVQDRINVSTLNRLVIQHMQAFRQRWVVGIDVEDENGDPMRPFDPGADLIWSVPGTDSDVQDVKFGDFDQSDLTGILASIETDIGVIGNLSRTPPQYLTGQLVNVSGDALTVAESALVGKVKNRQLGFGESWERVIRLAGMYGSVSVAQDAAIQWADPERYSISTLAAAAVQWQSAGVPFRPRMALLGFSPTEIDRLEAERTTDALLESLNNPVGVAPGMTTTTLAIPGDDPSNPASAIAQPAVA